MLTQTGSYGDLTERESRKTFSRLLPHGKDLKFESKVFESGLNCRWKLIFFKFSVMCRFNTGSSLEFGEFLCLRDSFVNAKWLKMVRYKNCTENE